MPVNCKCMLYVADKPPVINSHEPSDAHGSPHVVAHTSVTAHTTIETACNDVSHIEAQLMPRVQWMTRQRSLGASSGIGGRVEDEVGAETADVEDPERN